MKTVNIKIKGLCALLFSLCAFHIQAVSVNFLSPGDFCSDIEQSFYYNFISSKDGCNTEYSTLINLDARELLSRTGIKCNPEDFDFSSQLIYWPTFFGFVNAGLCTGYHFYVSQDESMEHDFTAGLAIKLKVRSVMDFFIQGGYLWKLAVIPTSLDTVKIFDSSINCGCGIDIYPAEKLSVNLGVYTTSFYDYPLFQSFFFDTGIKYEINEKAFLSANIETKWLDFYSICPFPNQAGITVTGGYRL